MVVEMYNSFGQVVGCMVDQRREEKKLMKERRRIYSKADQGLLIKKAKKKIIMHAQLG